MIGTVYQHRKGGYYRLLGVDHERVVYIALKDDTLWWRPVGEFFDGRFALVEHHPGEAYKTLEQLGVRRG